MPKSPESEDIFELIRPNRPTNWPEIPLIFSIPHSGRVYPPEFLAQSAVDVSELRRSEDALVDQFFVSAPNFGATLLIMRLARIYIDVNRSEDLLDPLLIEDIPPHTAIGASPFLASGIGVLTRLSALGNPIYRARISHAEAKARIDRFYRPFHAQLAALIAEYQARFGHCIVIDCHSMPPVRAGVDIVLGDQFGRSCHASLIDQCEKIFRGFGYRVKRNDPYAGGYITQHYGQSGQNIQVLQIEIARTLYLDDKTLLPSRHFSHVTEQISHSISELALFVQRKSRS
ncbi:MAG: N-formylglutamate amidohydrolase [Alphaproteobacteria bacterium]|nr:N-formylglutamate amidohydrolase [Alphaproteobacteria bacterium]